MICLRPEGRGESKARDGALRKNPGPRPANSPTRSADLPLTLGREKAVI
jgi:hypothetical protein